MLHDWLNNEVGLVRGLVTEGQLSAWYESRTEVQKRWPRNGRDG
jgi:hypothetical protein